MTRGVLLALLLVGCTPKAETVLSTVAIKPDPFAADCRAECRIPCKEPPTPIKEGDDGYATDRLAVELADLRRECEARRNACVECIDRAVAAGVVR